MNIFSFGLTLQPSLFVELSLVIAIGVVVAVIMRLLRQPLIVSHIISGLIVGPFFLNFIHSLEIFKLFSEIGIAILLFTVGLNIKPSLIKQFGKISLVTGLGQVLITSSLGFFVCLSLGYGPKAASYIAIALAFSSTIIILKLLSDKGELESLHAKIATGFLLVQDIIALILLFAIPLISDPDSSIADIGWMFAKGIALTLILILFARRVLRPLNTFLANSQELLFLFSLSWGFVVAAIFQLAGFSLETGALIAGVALATLPSRSEIAARLTPLRDFFVVVFFIMLGAQMVLTGIERIIPTALLLSLFVLVGNPIIMMVILRFFGYHKKTSFKTGLTVAQISEFSLILVSAGLTLGHVDASVMSLVTLVGLITIFISTYMIMYSDKLYDFLEPWLGVFEKANAKEPVLAKRRFPVIIFGCNRIGHDFVESFQKARKKFLIVDYDPVTVREFESLGLQAEFGDAGDINYLETIDASLLELAVSTIPVFDANALIIQTIRKTNKKAVLMAVAHSIKDAMKLYDLGADYVILPHFLGGQYAIEMLRKAGKGRRHFTPLKAKHLHYLHTKLALGHEHPETKRD